MSIKKKCIEISDTIYSISDLEKKERDEILKHIESCPDCKSLIQGVNQIYFLLGKHLDDQFLVDYTVSNDSLTKDEIILIEQHLNVCHICKEKQSELQNDFAEINTFWEESGFPDFEMMPNSKERDINFSKNKKYLQKPTRIFKRKRNIYKILSVAAVFLILLLFFKMHKREASIFDLARLNDIKIPVSIRGGDFDGLQNAILFINKGNYSEAIDQLLKYLKQNNEPDIEDYTRYLLAISYLKMFEKNNKTDHSLIDKGISELDKVNSASNNLSLNEDVSWYKGKAYLLKGNIKEAVYYFKQVSKFGANRLEESQNILKQLENINLKDSHDL